MVHGAPDPRLGGYVLSYCAYDERTGSFVRRRELPSDRVVAIINLGAPIRVRTPEGVGRAPRRVPRRPARHVRADRDRAARSAACRSTSAPVGAHLLLRLPMHELTGRVVDARGAVRPRGRCSARGDSPRPPAGRQRFELLDAFFLERLDDALSPVPSVTRALGRLRAQRRQRARRGACGRARLQPPAPRRRLPRAGRRHAEAARPDPALPARRGAERGTGPGWAEIAQTLRLLRPGAPDPRLQPVRGQLAGGVRAPPAARRWRRCRRLTRCSSASARPACSKRSWSARRAAAVGSWWSKARPGSARRACCATPPTAPARSG